MLQIGVWNSSLKFSTLAANLMGKIFTSQHVNLRLWRTIYFFLVDLLTTLLFFFNQGNYVGLNEEEIASLSDDDLERKLKRSYDILANAGAHYVIDSISDLPPVIADINRRLASGEKPWTMITKQLRLL